MILIWLVVSSAWGANFDSHQSAICESQECSESIGAFVFREADSQDAHICAATLISDDEILTNLHCLPKELRRANAACAEAAEFLMPSTLGLEAARVACQAVVRVSATSPFGGFEDVPDWAIIRLAGRPKRTAARFNTAQLPFATRVHAYLPLQVNIGLAPIIEFQKVECATREVGYLHPLTFAPSSPLFSLHHCEQNIVPGNSGSGFFDATGAYVGLLSMAEAQKGQSLESLRADGSPAGGGTKAHCIPLGDRTLPPECTQARTDKDAGDAASAFSVMHALSLEAALHGRAPSAKRIHFARGAVAKLVAFFEQIYPDIGYADAREYYLRQGRLAEVEQLDGFARAVLPAIPDCVSRGFASEELEIDLFTIRDIQAPPNGDGELYLSTDNELSLITPSRRFSLLLHFKKESETGASLEFSEADQKKFWSPDDERAYRRCNQGAKENCADLNSKKGFALYLKSFRFELPICADAQRETEHERDLRDKMAQRLLQIIMKKYERRLPFFSFEAGFRLHVFF